MVSELYRIEFRPAAIRSLKKTDKRFLSRILRNIESLAHNPRQAGTKKLVGEENLWRLRVGDYRVIYTIQDTIFLVLVVQIGHRREIYR